MTHYFSPHAKARATAHKWRMRATRKTVQLSEANNAGRTRLECSAVDSNHIDNSTVKHILDDIKGSPI